MKQTESNRRHVVQNTVKELDEKVDACRATDEDRDTRIQLLQEWDDLERVEAMDLAQDVSVTFPSLSNGSVLSFDDANSLECMITVEEIKTAVWDCNCNKASGPDGFTFLFVKTYWDLIKDNVASTSILINGSPSSEFSLKRGLRQGDPIPLFLFILVMEGLHLALKEAVQTNLIRGATVGLQININKSNIYGIGVSPKEVYGQESLGDLTIFTLAVLYQKIEFVMTFGLGIGVDKIWEVTTMKLWFRYCLTLVEDNKSDNSISHPPGFTPVNVEDSKHRDRQEGSASFKSRTSEFCSRVWWRIAQDVDDNPSPVRTAI
ncbi:hypothetical protein Tco_0775265 [Tanacetum coccineum]